MSKLRMCPFCGVGLIEERGKFYLHPVNGCIMSGFPIEKDSIERWNTRKPMEAIIKQLEQQEKQYNRRADEAKDKSVQLANHNRGKACSYGHALEIVKGFL